jgi:C4-dicarboxylate-binding protein DctP
VVKGTNGSYFRDGFKKGEYQRRILIMKKGLMTVFVVSLITVVLVSGMVSAKTTIKLVYNAGPGSLHEISSTIFRALVNDKTNGEVEIKIITSNMSERAMGEGLSIGTIDAAVTSGAAWVGYEPLVGIVETPFIFRDGAHARKVLLGPIGEEILAKASEKAGVKILTYWDYAWESGGRQITNNVRPVKVPADLAGLRIRNPKVPVFQLAVESLGATPVAIAWPELYMALEKGVVDGQHNQFLHVMGAKFYEVQKHISVINFARTPHTLTFSKNAWNKLSEKQQKLVLEAAKETAILAPAKMAIGDEKAIEELEGKMQVVHADEVDREAFIKILEEKAFPEYRKMFGEWFDRIINEGL